MENWVAFSRGMPSHLHDDDTNVTPLSAEDIEHSPEGVSEAQLHFHCLVELTDILCGIRETYYIVKATSKLSQNLVAALEEAKPFRRRLQEWQECLPSSLRFTNHKVNDFDDRARAINDFGKLDGNGSLHLSYVITHMALFRALLRPVDSTARDYRWDQTAHESISAVLRGALVCIKELVEFIESLTERQWNAFWHSCKYLSFHRSCGIGLCRYYLSKLHY